FQVFFEAAALGVSKVELLAAVHEDHVVLEQVGIADVDQVGGGVNLQFEFALVGGAEEIEECAGGIVAAAAVGEFGDLDRGAGTVDCGGLAGVGGVEGLFFAFGFAVGGVGEDVDADREGVGDVFNDLRWVALPLAGAGEFPVAGEVFGAVDDAG